MPSVRQRTSRRPEILRLFTELVAEHGYDNTAIGDIARELNISKGTVVHHFGSKDRMLAEVESAYMRRRLTEAGIILRTLDSPIEQLAGLIYSFVLVHRDDRPATIVVGREFVRFVSDDSMREVRALRDEYTSMLRRVIERGVASGVLRNENPALVTLQIFGMCNWAWTWLRPGGANSAEEVAATFIRTLLSGIVLDGSAPSEVGDPKGAAARVAREAMLSARGAEDPGVVPTRETHKRDASVPNREPAAAPSR
jgi:AcrR family transcriptional regulator